MYVKQLSENEKQDMFERTRKINALQEKGVCYSCQNSISGDIFPEEGLTFYEDERVKCLFEKYPRATGHTIIVSKEHYEDISEMPLDLGTHILKVIDAIIKLLKEIVGAEKVYVCTICDGRRNHLHFQLFPRLIGESIGNKNFVRENGIITDYSDTIALFRERLKAIL